MGVAGTMTPRISAHAAVKMWLNLVAWHDEVVGDRIDRRVLRRSVSFTEPFISSPLYTGLGMKSGRMPKFKAPRAVVFGELPQTSTSKLQKFAPRGKATPTAAIDK